MRVTISYGSGGKIERRTAAQTRRRFAPLPGKPAPLPSKARPKAPAPWLRRHRRPRTCGAPEYAGQGIVPLPAGRRSAFLLPFRARFWASPGSQPPDTQGACFRCRHKRASPGQKKPPAIRKPQAEGGNGRAAVFRRGRTASSWREYGRPAPRPARRAQPGSTSCPPPRCRACSYESARPRQDSPESGR